MCPTSVSKVGDITATSSSQNKKLHVNYSTPPNKDPPEGKTTAVITVMRGKPPGMVATATAVTSTTSKS